jgi:hypothetical protein
VAEKDYWSFAEMQTLRTLTARGETFLAISKALPGRSRAACISKAHKLGIFSGQTPAERRREQAERLRAARALLGGSHA